MASLTQLETPEEKELASKRQELEALQSQLADAELDFHTLHAQLAAFESQYFQIVGKRLARLDDLQAQVAEARAARSPKNEPLAEQASQARRQAEATAEAFEEIAASPPKESFKPTEECRKLYLKAAKAMHPDLAPNPEDKQRRHKFMAALNEAYEAGDAARIQQILHDWNSSPESVSGDGVGAELIRAIRQIAQAQIRLQEIQATRDALLAGELHQLWSSATGDCADATEHLQRIAAILDEEIETLKQDLEQLEAGRYEDG
jgi:hypothetical protein